MTYNEYLEELKKLQEPTVISVDDGSSYEAEWAEAIDRTLADAAIDAFKQCMTTRIAEVLNKPEPTNRDFKWLQKQMSTKIDILNKIIHLSKTEDVPHEHDEQREGPGEGTENEAN